MSVHPSSPQDSDHRRPLPRLHKGAGPGSALFEDARGPEFESVGGPGGQARTWSARTAV